MKAAGVVMVGKTLCAYDGYVQVECSGTLTTKGKRIKAKWTLEKRTTQRAKLTYDFEGPGVFQYDSVIIRPADIGAKSF